jgi:hypothetical protein
MIQKIEVVSKKDLGKDARFFCQDTLHFDMFFAYILSREDDQDIMVFTANGGFKRKIRRWTICSLEPRQRFSHLGNSVGFLSAFQFAEGDSFSIQVRDNGGLADDGLKMEILQCYLRFKAVPVGGDLSLSPDEIKRRMEYEKTKWRSDPLRPLIFGPKPFEKPLESNSAEPLRAHLW